MIDTLEKSYFIGSEGDGGGGGVSECYTTMPKHVNTPTPQLDRNIYFTIHPLLTEEKEHWPPPCMNVDEQDVLIINGYQK